MLICGRDQFSGADLWHMGLWGVQFSDAVTCRGIGKMSHKHSEALDEGYGGWVHQRRKQELGAVFL